MKLSSLILGALLGFADPAWAQSTAPNGIVLDGRCPDTAPAGTLCLNTTKSIGGNASIGAGPARAFIFFMTLSETAGQAVTVNLGTSAGASDVASGLSVPASGSLLLMASQFNGNDWFPVSKTLYVSSATWGGAKINVQTEYLVGP